MKPDYLFCVNVKPGYDDLFTPGLFYPIKAVSPNGVMASVVSDTSEPCDVVINSSVYGKFKVFYDVSEEHSVNIHQKANLSMSVANMENLAVIVEESINKGVIGEH